MTIPLRARGGWIVFVAIVSAVVVGVGAWRGIGPLSYLWPVGGSLSSMPSFAAHKWRQNGQTIILALSANCQECLQSAGFYRALARAAPGKFDLIAAFDDDAVQGRRRLDALDITVQEVVAASRNGLGIETTPSVLLVDETGVVKQRWTGLLDSLQRGEVAEALGIELPGVPSAAPAPSVALAAPTSEADPGATKPEAAARPPVSTVHENPSVRQLRAAFAQPDTAVIIDVRPRDLVRQLRIDGSINIPRDELGIRLLHEVDLKRALFVFCDSCAECEKVTPSVADRDLCRRSLDQLKTLGATDVTIIDASLMDLKAAGIRLLSGDRE